VASQNHSNMKRYKKWLKSDQNGYENAIFDVLHVFTSAGK
jgi:hypothetical protein